MTGVQTCALPICGEVVSQHIPAAGTYASRNIDGMAVLVADLEANRQVLKGTLGG